MSEMIQRYRFVEFRGEHDAEPDPAGEYVRYEDHLNVISEGVKSKARAEIRFRATQAALDLVRRMVGD